ncbi:MAG: flagellar M-ring protein FliF [Candidatus Melainabacteria bacterium RIFCSPLOWO2_02_FULL_35_15]|nr:MAG: flagellar M-ring protein FliF [Candidatus Melainabacteria bacterium RIFCSPLOWO2_12_FULL_35_11]OGI13766.1 MAG: flagellar M-ring protein FliF [Candidatus Melainabacteria bacterium RIFCSPLOWO2_02_FULL_35_15]
MATEQTQLNPQNVQNAMANLGQNKRMVLIGAGVIIVILTLIIVIFAWTHSQDKGTQIELVKKIDQGRAFEIISKLKLSNIEGRISDSDLPGKVNVQVFQKDFDGAALTLARSDLLQEDGFNLFDKSDWAASDYDKRIKMMRAVNGDLSRIISRMTGIKWATVRVNIPEPQLFSQYQAPTTATVQIELPDENLKLARAQVRSIINLLVGYVPNLQKNNISVIDTNGETYSSVETEEVAASELVEESEKVNKIIQKRIEEYLQPLLGYNGYIVRVSSEISRRKIEESATTFADGVVGQEQIGDERLGGAASDGHTIGPAVPGLEGNKNYARTNRVTQRYPSFKQKTISTPPGRISKITVAVALNSDLLPKISVKQLREGIAAITSPATTVDDIKITVAEFATGKPPSAKPVKSFAMPSFADYLNQVINFFKGMPRWAGIAIAVIGFLMVINSFRGAVRPPESPTSTVSQINQSMQKQFQKPEGQISQTPEASPAELTAQQPDLTGILTGLKEAAIEKPEFLASKLQIWLEEGSQAGRI